MKLRPIGFTPDGELRAPWRIVFFAAALFVMAVMSTVFVTPAAEFVYEAIGLRSATFSGFVDVVAIFCATWMALRWRDGKPWSDVGLGVDSVRGEVISFGGLLGAATIAIPIVILLLVGWASEVPAAKAVFGHPLIRLTVILLPSAFAEELLMRGYLLTVLRDAWNWGWAIGVTSVAFGLLHLQNAGADARSLALVMLAGVFLATIRVVTGSLYAAWAAHFTWNWVMAAIFHAPVSGYAFETPGYRYVEAGPDWATGGPWGPEGGLVAGLGMLAGIGILLLWRKRPEQGEQ